MLVVHAGRRCGRHLRVSRTFRLDMWLTGRSNDIRVMIVSKPMELSINRTVSAIFPQRLATIPQMDERARTRSGGILI
jgi:hypothetical protein